MTRRVLYIFLVAIFALSTHGFLLPIWTTTVADANVPSNYLSINLTLVDLPLFLFGLIAVLLLYFNDNFYAEIEILVKSIVLRLGGIWWVLLLVWMLLSSLWAREALLSRYHALHMLLELIAACGVAYAVIKGKERPLLYAFVIMAIFQSVLAILQLSQGESLGFDWLLEFQRTEEFPIGYAFLGERAAELDFRSFGLERHPNTLASSLSLAVFVAFLLWKSPFMKVAVVIIIVGLLTTFSRSKFAITGVSIILLLLLQRNIPRRLWLRGSAIIAGCSLLILLIFGGRLWQDVQNRTLIYINNPQVLLDRLVFARGDTTAVWRESPIFGVGADNLMVEIGYLRQGLAVPTLPIHNTYLLILAELGVVGLALFLLGISYFCVQAHPDNPFEVQVLAVIFIGLALSFLFEFHFWERPRWRLIIFLFMGLSWGYQMRYLLSSSDWRAAASVLRPKA